MTAPAPAHTPGVGGCGCLFFRLGYLSRVCIGGAEVHCLPRGVIYAPRSESCPDGGGPILPVHPGTARTEEGKWIDLPIQCYHNSIPFAGVQVPQA